MSDTRWEFIQRIAAEVGWSAKSDGNSIRFISSLPEISHWSEVEIGLGIQRAPKTSEGR